MPTWSITLALWTCALSTKPSVSTSRCRLRPFTFLPRSKRRFSPPTAVLLAPTGYPQRPRWALRISFQAHSQTFSEGSIDPLPATVDTPSSEVVVVEGRPTRELVRQEPPLATALHLQEVEDGIEDLAKSVDPGRPHPLGAGRWGSMYSHSASDRSVGYLLRDGSPNLVRMALRNRPDRLLPDGVPRYV